MSYSIGILRAYSLTQSIDHKTNFLNLSSSIRPLYLLGY